MSNLRQLAESKIAFLRGNEEHLNGDDRAAACRLCASAEHALSLPSPNWATILDFIKAVSPFVLQIIEALAKRQQPQTTA